MPNSKDVDALLTLRERSVHADKLSEFRIRELAARCVSYHEAGIGFKKLGDNIPLGVPSPRVRIIRSEDTSNQVGRLFERAERSLFVADSLLSDDVFSKDVCAALLGALKRGVGLFCISGPCVEGHRHYLERSNPLVSVMDESVCCDGTNLPVLIQFYQVNLPLGEQALVRDGEEVLTYQRDDSGEVAVPRVFNFQSRVKVASEDVLRYAVSPQARLPISPKDYVYGCRRKILKSCTQPHHAEGPEETTVGDNVAILGRMFDSFVRQRQVLIRKYQSPKDRDCADWREVDRWVHDSVALDEEYFEFVKGKLACSHYGEYAAISFGRLLGVAADESGLFSRVRAVYPDVGLYIGHLVPEKTPERLPPRRPMS